MENISHLERKLKRETLARKAAEKLLEDKSLELYQINSQLQSAMKQLEKRSEQHLRKFEFEDHIDRVLISFGHSFLAKKLDEIQLHSFVRQITENPLVTDSLLYLNEETFPELPVYLYGNTKLQGCENSYCRFNCWEENRLFMPIMVERKQVAGFVFILDTSEVDRETISTKLALIGELIKVALSRSLLWQREVELRLRAEESEKATKEFVAMINHELRTPLNGVLGSVDLLQRTVMNDEQQEYLQNLSQGGELLRVLINDLLDFSKMNAGMMEIVPKHFMWQQLEQSINGIFAAKSEESGVEFLVETDGIPQVLLGDQERIKQILVNLIGNAFKFTREGSVTLDAAWRCGTLTFEVTDTGIGIARQAMESLYDPFIQADRSSSRTFEGTGLGLAICKNLADLMNGTIECESEPGKGTCFRLSLAVAEGDSAECAQGVLVSEQPHINWQSVRVLVVDDTSLNQLIVKQMLGKIGVEPDICSNGLEAITAVNSKNYHMVFMDCRMPEMDGYQATERLREQGINTPIIALTAASTLEERQMCIESGMDDILSKPYTADEIKQVMVEWLDKGRQRQKNRDVQRVNR
ncbi:ATP-binding protein [Vibrio sp. SCSIO 43137]|uniref:ATP-binding protein n=1 Tax=Vibrio sp. SCSIO 43137 TaxID=3021011 RepID=UPI0023077664|nr:ATP-binding protein [Vibrio sp. SCSIO 43137]WCE28496.1 ATP-binding protein [Vibrio sp. SCSIO 43137]